MKQINSNKKNNLPIFRIQKSLLSFVIIVAAIFLSEVIAMSVIYLFKISNVTGFVLLDATIISLLVMPVLYIFGIRPLEKQIDERKKAEQALQLMVSEQESIINDRTSELSKLNILLQREINERIVASQKLSVSLEETQQKQKEISALLDAAKAVLETTEFSISARKIYDACKELIGASAGYIALVQDSENSVVFLDTGDYKCTVDESLPMPIRGMREEVYIEGVTTFHNDFLSTEWKDFLPEGHTITNNVLFAPLKLKGIVVGLLGLANKPEGFTQNDANLATAFSEIAAVALINSSAIQTLRESQDQLEQGIRDRTKEIEKKNIELVNEISERRRIENQLRIQTTALEAAANGIIITDLRGNIIWANEAFSKMTGFSNQEALGKNTQILRSNQHPKEFYKILWQDILSGKIWEGEIINRRKDGSLYVEYQTITPVLNDFGEIVNFIAIKQDITERKKFEDELEQTNRELVSISMAERKQRLFAETLSEASRIMSNTLEIEQVTDSLFDYLYRFIQFDAAYTVIAQGDSSLIVESFRESDEYPGSKHDIEMLLDPDVENPMRNMLFNPEILPIPDLKQIPNWNKIAGMDYIRSWLSIPMRVTDKVIGIVILISMEPDSIKMDHAQLADAIASQAAAAIQNSWLFEQVRSGRERLLMLSRKLVEVQENERREIARELHDETGQAMTSLKLELQVLENDASHPDKIRSHLVNLRRVSDEVMESLHRLAKNLRPASLEHLGFVVAVKNLVETVGEKQNIQTYFRAIGFSDDERLDVQIESALYRIVQEALTNVVKHAKANRVDVILEKRNRAYSLIVEDDGCGFNTKVLEENDRLGLIGIRERVEQLGGTILIESQDDVGTTLVVEVPIDY